MCSSVRAVFGSRSPSYVLSLSLHKPSLIHLDLQVGAMSYGNPKWAVSIMETEPQSRPDFILRRLTSLRNDADLGLWQEWSMAKMVMSEVRGAIPGQQRLYSQREFRSQGLRCSNVCMSCHQRWHGLGALEGIQRFVK